MPVTGHPTLHGAEYNEQARNHCLLGATNSQFAELFDASPRTIDSWIAGIPEFAAAVREDAQSPMAHSPSRLRLPFVIRYTGESAATLRNLLRRLSEILRLRKVPVRFRWSKLISQVRYVTYLRTDTKSTYNVNGENHGGRV